MLVLLAATLVLSGMWTYRANANLHAAGVEGMSYTPGWAVGWYFVPFANLIKPFDALREIWNLSHGSDNAFSRSSPGHLRVWWGCWIVGNTLSNIGTFNGDASTAPVRALGSIVLFAAAILFAQIIRQVPRAGRAACPLGRVRLISRRPP